MKKLMYIKTINIGFLLAVANYSQALCGGTGVCGTNCIFEYDSDTITYKPADSSQPAIIDLNSRIARNNVIIAEGITEIKANPNEIGSPFNGWNQSTGKLILPSTLRNIGEFATHTMKFSVIEINSKELNLESNSFSLISDNTTLVVNPDIKITGSFEYPRENHYPKNLTIACKGKTSDCSSKMSASLAWIYSKNGGNINYENYKGHDENGGWIEYNEDGSIHFYDSNHRLTGLKNVKEITPAEAAALVKKGNYNTVTLTFK